MADHIEQTAQALEGALQQGRAQPQNQEQVDATNPLRVMFNLFKASQEGYTSKINQGDTHRTTLNHGHQLAPAGFGAWRNQ